MRGIFQRAKGKGFQDLKTAGSIMAATAHPMRLPSLSGFGQAHERDTSCSVGSVKTTNGCFLIGAVFGTFKTPNKRSIISRLLDLPTAHGIRRDTTEASQQDVLLTTHAPFVPSDMSRDKVLIFGKKPELGKEPERIVVMRPTIETFGSTFDAILDVCFDVRPPFSEEPRKKITELKNSHDPNVIRQGMEQLGPSVEKAFLADRLRQLPEEKSK